MIVEASTLRCYCSAPMMQRVYYTACLLSNGQLPLSLIAGHLMWYIYLAVLGQGSHGKLTR